MLTNIRFFILLSFVAASFALSACETVDGAGRDIENAGESIQDSSN
jgi:predicted small secreted protein